MEVSLLRRTGSSMLRGSVVSTNRCRDDKESGPMCEPIQVFGQREYSRVLKNHRADVLELAHEECVRILMEHGASHSQANNGAYQFIHHRDSQVSTRGGTQDEYDSILDRFDARHKRPRDCIHYLESMGFSFGQAKTAVHKYRSKRGLIR